MSRAAAAIYAVMILSGLAGLGYQVVWVHMLSLGLGHEVFAVLAVVAAFFAGLALGGRILDRALARSSRPDRWYIGLELVIGVWALALIWLMPWANGTLSDLMGPEPSEARRWAVAFVGPALLLLPATLAMGATLPAAERVFAAQVHDRGVGGIYAANTAGAMAGCLVTAVWLAPELGYTGTLVCFAAANFICAAWMALIGGTATVQHTQSAPRPGAGLLIAIFATGFLGIGFEVAGVRALAQILENTVYSFAAALAVFLLATALGAASWQALGARHRGTGVAPGGLSVLAGLTGLGASLGVLAVFHVGDIYDAVRVWAGPGLYGAMLAELAGAALVFGPAALGMGATFAHLAQGARGPGGGLGIALAANTLGAALAPFAVGVVGVPALGSIGTMVALAGGYLLLAIGAVLAAPGLAPPGPSERWHRVIRPAMTGFAGVAGLGVLGWSWAGPFDWRLVTPPPGGSISAHREGVAGSATTVDTANGTRFLRVNGTFTMGGTASYRLDRLQAHAALMQHPAPRRALFLGVGTGATVAAAAAHPNLDVWGVDLSPEVLDLISEFPAVTEDLAIAGDRLRLSVADARRAVRVAEGRYDLILADTYHPAKDGAGLLYTREHFIAIRERLDEDGLFVQWLPLHQLDIATLKLIVRTYLDVFPDARMFMGNYNLRTPLIALYASRSGRLPSLDKIAAREVPLPLRAALADVQLQTPYALLGGFLGASGDLKAWAGKGPLNTDDRPLVQFRAPRTVYEPLGPAHERLLVLTRSLEPRSEDAVDLSGVPRADELAMRLRAYWRARDAFLALGIEQPVTGNLMRDVRELAPRLIDILRLSPDFDPAYRPVLSMAQAVLPRNRQVAEVLLRSLAKAAPHRPEAKNILIRLQGP